MQLHTEEQHTSWRWRGCPKGQVMVKTIKEEMSYFLKDEAESRWVRYGWDCEGQNNVPAGSGEEARRVNHGHDDRERGTTYRLKVENEPEGSDQA